MIQYGQHLTQWTDTHEVEVIHKDAKGTVTSVEIITCTRSHDLNRTFYTCPSCGKSEQKDYDTVRHTCSYCSTQELPY